MEFEEAIHNEELGDLLHTASFNLERDGNSNPLTWITDLEGRILTCNREASDLLDTLLETDSDHSIFDLPVSDLQRQSIIALYKNGQFPTVISVNLTADGTENQVYVFSFNPS